jgi:hypothetical protein
MSPAIFWTSESRKIANDMIHKWPERSKRGMELVCLEAVGAIAEAVKQKAPVLPDGTDYSKDLQVALVNGGDGPAVCIYYKNQKTEIGEELTDNGDALTALYFTAKKGAPRWVYVLSKYNPWPANLLPEKPTPDQATVFARKITGSESDALSARIKRVQRAIEVALGDGGLENAQIRFDTKASEGLEVLDDISYSVLRAEFGYGGSQTSHWRPAIRAMVDSLSKLGEKFAMYVQTGKENIFQIPDHGEISVGELASYQSDFQQKMTTASGISGR